MGTNYYLHTNVCKCCDRPEEIIHIGKCSAGWTFSFHATDSIRSWKDWQVELKRSINKIIDEYGSEISFDEFETMVIRQSDAPCNHTREMRKSSSAHPSYLERLFLDDEGHSFSEGEFS